MSTRVVILTLVFAIGHDSASAEDGSQDDEPAKLSAAFRLAAERAQPSIVTIETFRGPRETLLWARRNNAVTTSPGANQLVGDDPVGARDGGATGIIIDAKGYVLTCNHVVDGADMLFVKLQDGRRFQVEKVLQDPFTDVAVVRISGAEPFPAAELADTDTLRVGDWVVAFGNPYGLGVSMSGGVVSATRRHLSHLPYTTVIQTDAASNPGSSGGALVDLDGKVVGMSEGGYGFHEGFQGIGFAIPITVAAQVAKELIEVGRVTRPYFGFETEELTIDMGRYFGFTRKGGLIVCDVAPNSAAGKAGVHAGDVLTKVGDTFIEDGFQFLELVNGDAPFSPVTFTVLRAGTEISIDVLPEELSSVRRASMPEVVAEPSFEYSDEKLGLALETLSAETAKGLDYNNPVDGLLLTFVDPEGLAARQGICAGMSLHRVNDRNVVNAQEYRDAIEQVDTKKGVLLLIGTPRKKHFVLCKE